MEDKIYYLDFKTLENFMRDSLVGAGVPLEDAKICAVSTPTVSAV